MMNKTHAAHRIASVRDWIRLSLACLALSGCASIHAPPLPAGTPEAEVVARLGAPTHVYPADARQPRVLEYMTGPFGQETFIARIGPDGRLLSYEQVLNAQTFATIRIGVDTKTDILHRLGAPSETAYLSLMHQEVWSYPYKENPVADSMMHVYFDDAGIVRRLQNGPDLRRDPDHRGSFGFGFGRSRQAAAAGSGTRIAAERMQSVATGS